MSIVHLTPWKPFDDFPDQLAGWLDRPFWNDGEARHWRPALDVKENAENYVVCVDVPGVSNDDIEVTLDDTLLKIKGSRELERSSQDSDSRYRSFERVSGSFRRHVQLPVKASSADVSAVIKDGVLTVSIKKPETVWPKRIEVQA